MLRRQAAGYEGAASLEGRQEQLRPSMPWGPGWARGFFPLERKQAAPRPSAAGRARCCCLCSQVRALWDTWPQTAPCLEALFPSS